MSKITQLLGSTHQLFELLKEEGQQTAEQIADGCCLDVNHVLDDLNFLRKTNYIEYMNGGYYQVKKDK